MLKGDSLKLVSRITLITLIFSFALVSAKEVNVIYNFPLGNSTPDIKETVSVPDDANAFTAFIKAAEKNKLKLDITYYSFGAFINSINELSGSEDFTKYWQFSINNTPAMIGVSDFIPENNDTISLDYLDGRIQDAFEWLLDNQKSNGSFGENLFQNNFALAALSLAKDNNINAETAINNALTYTLSQQRSDAGFGNNLYTSTTLISLLSNGKKLNEFSKNGKTTIDLLKENQESDGGWKSGSNESDVDTTSWTLIAFSQAGISQPEKNNNSPSDFLLSTQHSNGSWGYNATDKSESIDFTEEALIALSTTGNSKDSKISNSLNWLSSQQNAEGCITDAFRTALGSIAFNSWNESTKASKAKDCLKTLQNGDGSFGRLSNKSNALDTGIAIIALSNATFPLNISNITIDENKFGLNSIAKFSVKIKNNSSIKAENISIEIEGIPSDWIIVEGSTTSLNEIKAGETKIVEIFAKLKSVGKFNIMAVVKTNQQSKIVNSNSVSIEVKEAMLEAVLTVE